MIIVFKLTSVPSVKTTMTTGNDAETEVQEECYSVFIAFGSENGDFAAGQARCMLAPVLMLWLLPYGRAV